LGDKASPQKNGINLSFATDFEGKTMKIDSVNLSLVAIKRLSLNLDEVEVTQAICEYCGKQISEQALEVLNHKVSDIC
jgi:RNA polymerase-binding transcription factor DksA